MVSVVLGAALFFLCYKIQNGRWTNFIATVTTTTRPNGCRETKPKKIYHSLPARIQLGNFFFSFESTVEMIFLAEVLSEGSQLGLIDSMRVTDRFLSLSFFLSLSLSWTFLPFTFVRFPPVSRVLSLVLLGRFLLPSLDTLFSILVLHLLCMGLDFG